MIRNKKVNIMIRIVAILVTFLIIMNFTQVLGVAYIAERNNTKVTSRDPSTTEQTTTQQKNYKIAIMAGHSTSEVGARSPEGDSNYPVIKEEDLTVKVADNVEKYLSKYSNIQVVQTGSTLSNRNVQDNGRLQKAIDADVDMLVGIHFNDINGTWQEDNGILMCYNQAGTAGNGQASEAGSSAESKKLGATLKSKVSSKMGLGKGKDVEKALFTIGNSSNTDFPSVIIECGYLSSKKDYEVISKEDGLKKCAEGIVDGILDYLQIENTGYGSGSSSSGSKKLKTTIKSNEDKFLGLWKNKKGIYIPYYNSDGTINNDALFDKKGKVVTYKLPRSHSKYSPVRNVLDNAEVLFEILNISQRTQQYEKLMRYLLYKYTGDDIYGVTDFDFSVFDIDSFNKAGFNCSDFVVKTDESNTAPVLEKAQLEEGLKAWLKDSKQLSNALSVIDGVLECQEKYKVNAVFIYALMMDETTMGTANTNWVAEKNWCSLTAYGHRDWGTPQANIDKCAWNIAEGDYYFKQGLYTVHEIGAVYCADPPPPAWGDQVQAFMKELYEAAGVDLSQFMGGDILEVCQEITQTFMNRNAHYSVEASKLIYGDIERCYNESNYICCATYVSMALYKSGMLTAEQINSYNYHYTGDGGIPDMLQAAGWRQVSASEAQPGDVVNHYTEHVLIYAGNGQCWDQTSAVISSSGRAPTGTTTSYDLSKCQIWRAHN